MKRQKIIINLSTPPKYPKQQVSTSSSSSGVSASSSQMTTEELFQADSHNGAYEIIYADPPWMYSNANQPGLRGTVPYKMMTVEEICALPVRNITTESAVLFLWATFPKIEEALEVITAWGFTYVTCGFVWVKTKKDGVTVRRSGLGRYTMSNAEICLIGRHPQAPPPRNKKNIRQIVEAPTRRHSQKPDIVRKLITALYGSERRRIELFARFTPESEHTAGWDWWGDGAFTTDDEVPTTSSDSESESESESEMPTPTPTTMKDGLSEAIEGAKNAESSNVEVAARIGMLSSVDQKRVSSGGAKFVTNNDEEYFYCTFAKLIAHPETTIVTSQRVEVRSQYALAAKGFHEVNDFIADIKWTKIMEVGTGSNYAFPDRWFDICVNTTEYSPIDEPPAIHSAKRRTSFMQDPFNNRSGRLGLPRLIRKRTTRNIVFRDAPDWKIEFTRVDLSSICQDPPNDGPFMMQSHAPLHEINVICSNSSSRSSQFLAAQGDRLVERIATAIGNNRESIQSVFERDRLRGEIAMVASM